MTAANFEKYGFNTDHGCYLHGECVSYYHSCPLQIRTLLNAGKLNSQQLCSYINCNSFSPNVEKSRQIIYKECSWVRTSEGSSTVGVKCASSSFVWRNRKAGCSLNGENGCLVHEALKLSV